MFTTEAHDSYLKIQIKCINNEKSIKIAQSKLRVNNKFKSACFLDKK